MSDRGVHPDLIDEVAAEREQATEAPQEARSSGGRRRGRSSPPGDSATAASATAPAGEVLPALDGGASPDQGDEQASDWRTAETPEEAFKRLAKQLPSEVLQKDEVLSGLIGSRADLRARELIRNQQIADIERQKREAAARGDLYTLGELTAGELQPQLQLEQTEAQAAAQLAPVMEVVEKFQRTLPDAVQKDVGGRIFGAGKPYVEGLQEYLGYVTDQAIKLGVERELRDRESALRKSVLSEVNGSEPVPEREGGTPPRVRVVTSEQVDAMSLAEYDALFDANGHPRPGVQYRVTRGTPLTRQ